MHAWLDFVSLFFLGYAFIAGFQKGIWKTFSAIIAFCAAIWVDILIAPQLFKFIEFSFARYHNELQLLGFFTIFLTLLFIFLRIARFLSPKEQTTGHVMGKITGGILLSTVMVISLAVFYSFAEQAHLLSSEIKSESITYRVLQPIRKQSAKMLYDLKNGAQQVKTRNLGAPTSQKVSTPEDHAASPK